MVAESLDELRRRFAERTPKSAALFERACLSLPGGNTRNNLHFAPYPPTIAQARSGRLEDVDGHVYIDFLNDYTSGFCGHVNSIVREAAETQLRNGLSYGARSGAEVAFAECVKDAFPSMELVRFVNSGTEANLYAVLTAMNLTGRRKIVVFEGGYHGGPMNFGHSGPDINLPLEFVILPYNDVDALDAAMDRHGPKVAVIIAELMFSAGGCIPAEPDFARALQERARSSGALFIADEIVTSRLAFGGLQGVYGLNPDMTTLGKYIAGGFSIGAFGGRRALLDVYNATRPDFRPHGGTFNNNSVSMAVGHAVMRNVATPEAIADVSARGDRLRNALNACFDRVQAPVCASGIGSVMNLHLGRTAPKQFDRHPKAKAFTQLFHMYCLLAGIWIAPRGMMALSVETTDGDVECFVEIVASFVADYRDTLATMHAAT